MADFNKLKLAIEAQSAIVFAAEVFRTSATKDEMWGKYLGTFKPEDDPKFRERTEHDCTCCSQFIKSIGNAVAVINGELVSIWDVTVDPVYQPVVDAISAYVKSQPIVDKFFHWQKSVGTDFNHELVEGGDTIKWEHFHTVLPDRFVKREDEIPTLLGKLRTAKEVFKRGLDEFTKDVVEDVIELIEENQLHRGEEALERVKAMSVSMAKYATLETELERELFAWFASSNHIAATLRNSSMGTLLTDLSEGMELEIAVAKYEKKVSGDTYKRPNPIVSKAQIAKVEKRAVELGIIPSFPRRHAVMDDISIANTIYADRSVQEEKGIFGQLADELPVSATALKGFEEMSIQDFIDTVIPTATSIEVLIENRLENNFMSLIAPVNPDAPNILAWDNNYSYSYKGEVADALKTKVKKAGGATDVYNRVSLGWFNYDDLDLQVKEPDGTLISFERKTGHRSGGNLDVDMNISANTREAVENIVHPDRNTMQVGIHEVLVHNYTPRENIDVGFDVQVESEGVTHTFHYPDKVKGIVSVCKFNYSHENGIEIVKSIPNAEKAVISHDVWGINTANFQKVSMIMNSPNYWDDNKHGNRQLFFILEGCKNDFIARGFYNEFLRGDLYEDRKVFELLSSKMRVPVSDNQLSGLGFSMTKRNSVFCKVTGTTSRTIKINF